MAGLALLLCAAGAGVLWYLTEPERLDPAVAAQLGTGDAGRGERIFWAGGCASCHAGPGAEGDALLQLAGGRELETQFGTFVPPNISSDRRDGIGGWSVEDFANAMMRGVAPDGNHLYPSFPYTSYARMEPSDVADLFAYIQTLPPVSGNAAGHRLSFPYGIRRGIGLWKLLYLDAEPVVALQPDASPELALGRYLVEGPGHCGECHTPRDFAGGTDASRWLSGAVAAERGEGIVPNITPDPAGIAEWSAADIANYLETGFTPDFDTVGGSMVEVQRNMSRLRPEDREAIAAYLKAVPPHPNGYPETTDEDG